MLAWMYGKWNPYSLLVGVSNGLTIIELIQKFFKNLEIHLLYEGNGTCVIELERR